jgi:hypothetical protein
VIDVLATRRHFADHLRPVWEALPERGRWMTKPEPGPLAPFVLTAAYEDYKRARQMGYTRQAFLEHGIGQSYVGVRHGSYAGGSDRKGTELFLVPNDHAASRWQAAYPAARVEVVGSPRLDVLPRRLPGPGPVIAVSFHWPCMVAPEAAGAFLQFRDAVAELAKSYTVRGHGHPRHMDRLAEWYRKVGIEVVPDFDDVCRRADLYVFDNSSSGYEFASTGRPVVVLNRSGRGAYRQNIEHGLRFWSAAGVGENVWEPSELAGAVEFALSDPPTQQARREHALSIVYQPRTDVVTALLDWTAQAVAA